MARQLRIEYPGAFYHIYSRGNQKQPIFLSDDDRHFILKCLREAHEKFGVIVHTYCLMPNHYHLIIETPFGNLSDMMHFLNTMFSVYFNTRHKRCGHLFQGRYKSILIQAEGYAKQLSKYIHLNPVRAKIVDLPEQHPWSSYSFFCGTRRPEKWMTTSFILSLFGEFPEKARNDYIEFMNKEIGQEVPAAIKSSMRTGILGNKDFVARIKETFLEDKIKQPDRESPQLRKLRTPPDLPLILSMSEKILGKKNKLVRQIAVFISHKNSALTLKEIGQFFALSVSGASSACHRVRAAMACNTTLANAIEDIEREINGSKEKVA